MVRSVEASSGRQVFKPDTPKIPAIISFGSAVGNRKMTNSDMDTFLGRDTGFTDKLMKRGKTGIRERYWVDDEQATSDLIVQAVGLSMEKAGLRPSDITGLRIATSSPDMLGVSTAAIVQKKLGLRKDILGTNNGDACPGWIMGFYGAVTDLSSPYGRGGYQIVVGAEVISRSLSPKKPLNAAIFGDAAGATILTNVTPDRGAATNMGFAFGLDGSFADNLGIKAGGSRLKTSQETLDRDLHTIDMDGKLIFNQALEYMPEASRRAMEEAGVTIDQIELLIPHQANLLIIQETAKALGVPMEKVMVTIAVFGNTSASSIPIAMERAVENGQLNRNDLVGVTAFGAGVVFNAAIIPMVGLPRGANELQRAP